MSRRMFGWSYPPGVTGNEPEITGECGPCECCGNDPADCLCPECPVCHQTGNPACYHDSVPEDHGLKYSTAQLVGQSRMRIFQLKEQLQEEEMAYQQLKELLEQEEANASN